MAPDAWVISVMQSVVALSISLIHFQKTMGTYLTLCHLCLGRSLISLITKVTSWVVGEPWDVWHVTPFWRSVRRGLAVAVVASATKTDTMAFERNASCLSSIGACGLKNAVLIWRELDEFCGGLLGYYCQVHGTRSICTQTALLVHGIMTLLIPLSRFRNKALNITPEILHTLFIFSTHSF